MTMAIPMKNAPQLLGKMDRNPGKPPTPIEGAFTAWIEIKAPAIADPIMAEIKAKRKRRLTPNNAGSVTPRYAEIAEVTDKLFNFSSFNINNMASAADP